MHGEVGVVCSPEPRGGDPPMEPARNGVDRDDDGRPVKRRHRALLALRLVCAAAVLMVATASGAVVAPKPSPTPNPVIGEMENVVAELREVNASPLRKRSRSSMRMRSELIRIGCVDRR